MTETLQSLLPVLRSLSGPGAGVAAFFLFNALRSRFPQPAEAPASQTARLFYCAIYARRYARISAMVLAAAIALVASMLVAALTGGDIVRAADMSLAASLAAIVSQVAHAFGLSSEVPGHLVSDEDESEPEDFGFATSVKRHNVRIYGPEDVK